MDKHIFAAIFRRDETKPFSGLNHFTKPVILLDIIITFEEISPWAEWSEKNIREKNNKEISRGTNNKIITMTASDNL